MAKFRVQVAQDACIMWYADIEADNKEQAAEAALDQWNGRRNDIEFREGDAVGYDDATCDPEDCDLIEDQQAADAYHEIFGETVLERETRKSTERITALSKFIAECDALDRLSDEYHAWMRKNGLDLGSADEHLFDETLTEYQRAWLKDFYERWQKQVG